jgi:MFS family permease
VNFAALNFGKMETKLWNRNYMLVFIGIIFIFSNFYLLLSCLPLAIKDLMELSTQQMSLVVSIYFLGIVVTRPFSGMIADNWGKKYVAFLSFLLFSCLTAIYIGLNSLYLIVLIRFLHGITHSVGTTAHAAMAVDFSPKNMRGQAIGYYGLAMCLAMVIAPALGLYILEHYSYHILLVLATILGFLGTLSAAFIQKPVTSQPKTRQKFQLKNLIERKALPIGILSLILAICYSGIIAFIAVYMQEKHVENGSIYFYLAFAAIMIISRPYIGKIIDKKGASHLVYPSLILFSIGMIFMGFTDSLATVIVTGIILGLSYGCLFPSFQTLAVESCPSDRSGSAIGTFFLFYDLGFGLGAILLAKIANLSSYSTMYFIISSIVLLILILFSTFKKNNLITKFC